MFSILRTRPRERTIGPVQLLSLNPLKWLTDRLRERFSSYNVFQGLISHLITGVSTSSFLYTNTYAIHTFRVLSDNPIKSIGHRAFSIPDKPDEKVLM